MDLDRKIPLLIFNIFFKVFYIQKPIIKYILQKETLTIACGSICNFNFIFTKLFIVKLIYTYKYVSLTQILNFLYLTWNSILINIKNNNKI